MKLNAEPERQDMRYSKAEIHVLDGKNYEEWRIKFTTTLTREGVRKVLKDNNLETRYLKLENDKEREEKMSEYTVMQEISQSLLFERITVSLLRQVTYVNI